MNRRVAAGTALLLSLLALSPAGSGAQPIPSSDTLTLPEAVRIGLGADPDIAAERAGRASASGQRLAAWGTFLPELNAGVSFARSDFTTFTFPAPEGSARRLEKPESGVRKSSVQSLSFGWTVLEGGRRIASLKESAARLDATEHRISVAERETATEVRLAYFRVLRQRSLAEVAERQLEARRRDLALTRKRYGIAEAGRSEILGARSDTLDARMRLLEARRQARAEFRSLRSAMGVEASRFPISTPLARLEELPALDTIRERELLRRAIRTHPQLEVLAAEERAAAARRWAARARYLPRIVLGADLSRNETLGPEGDFFVFSPSNDQKSLRLTVSWSLFGGFQREQQERQAVADLRRVQAREARTWLEVRTTVRDRLEELRRRRERLELLRDKLELARERVEVTREQYRFGDRRHLDLQRVIEGLGAAERGRIAERYAYLRAWADLERVTGSLAGGSLPGAVP